MESDYLEKHFKGVEDILNGGLDRWIERRYEMVEVLRGGGLSVLVIDPDNEMPLSELEKAFPDLNLKYFDLADCREGDYTRIGQHLEQYVFDGKCAYDGLLFDNIDRIDAGADTEDLRRMVWQAMKRDNTDLGGYSLLNRGKTIPFDKMKIAARCREIPGFLQGKSLLAYFVDVSSDPEQTEDTE